MVKTQTPNATKSVLEGADAIRYLADMGFTDFVPVFGERHATEEDKVKTPIYKWGNHRSTAEEAIQYAEHGYWIAVVPPKGYIVIDFDIDDLVATGDFDSAKRRLVSVYGNTLWVETKRGIHFYFRYGEHEAKELKDVSGRHPCHVWHKVDYIKSTRYAIFVGDGRKLHPNPIQKLPEELYLKLNQSANKGSVFLVKTEGDRNNSLFEHGRMFRRALINVLGEAEAVDRASEAVERLNALMKEPLPLSELRDIQKSLSRPDREDFVEGGSFFRRNGQNTHRRYSDFKAEYETEETVEMTDNPFTKVLSFRDIQTMRRDRRWFMHGLIKHGDVVLIAGAPKSGKSTFMRSIAVSCVADQHQPLLTSKGKVLWFVFEEHHEDIADRIELAQQRYGINPDLLQFVVFNPSSMANPLPYFIAGLRQLLNDMRNDPPVAVIVDTVGRVFGGIDINDYTAVQQAIENIRWGIREFPQPPVIFLVHHTNKSEYKTPLGSQAFQGSADAIFTLDYDEEGAFMQCVGRNVDPSLHHKRIRLRFDPDTMLIIGVGELSSGVCELVEKIHSGEISLLKIAENYQGGVFKGDLKRLLRRGILLSDGNNIYSNTNHKDLQKYLDGAKKLKEQRFLQESEENNTKGVILNETTVSFETQEHSPTAVPVAVTSVSSDSKGAETDGQSGTEGDDRYLFHSQHGSDDNGHYGHSGETDQSEWTGGAEGEDLPDAEDGCLPSGAEGAEGEEGAETTVGAEGNEGAVGATETAVANCEVAEDTDEGEDNGEDDGNDEKKVEYIGIADFSRLMMEKRGGAMRFIKNDIPLSLQEEEINILKRMGATMTGKPADTEIVFPLAYRRSAWRVCHSLLTRTSDGFIPLSAYFPFADTRFTKVELPKHFAFLRKMWLKVKENLTLDGTNNKNIRNLTETIMIYVRREFQVDEDSPFNMGSEEDVLPILNQIGTVLEDLNLPKVFVLWLKEEPLPFLFTVKNNEWVFLPIKTTSMKKGYLHWLDLVRSGEDISPAVIEMDERLLWKGYLFHRADEETEKQAGKPVYVLSKKRVEVLDTEELLDYICFVLGLTKGEVRRLCSQKTKSDTLLANTQTD